MMMLERDTGWLLVAVRPRNRRSQRLRLEVSNV